MAIREYKCQDCNLITEKIINASQEIKESISCPKCKGNASYLEIPTSISLGVSSFSQAPLDNIIGKDSERRWENIHRRQEIRDKVRKESGSVGISMVGRDQFAPLTIEDKERRSELNEILPISGHKQTFDSSDDAKLINHK